MKARFFLSLAFAAIVLKGCSLGVDRFQATSDGVTYDMEVVVPLTNFVRIASVTTSEPLSGEVVIPPTVKYGRTTYVVSQIGKGAFRDFSRITSVTLPSTVSVIEEKAFMGCTSLEEINTPQPLSTIGAYAFDGRASLEDFSLQASISTLGEGCFRGCSSLASVTFPTSLNHVPPMAFQGCTSLGSIFIDSTVLTIGEKAFAGCTGVVSFVCMTPTPPATFDNTFVGMNPEIPVTVPMASVEQYYDAIGWRYFVNYQGRN